MSNRKKDRPSGSHTKAAAPAMKPSDSPQTLVLALADALEDILRAETRPSA